MTSRPQDVDTVLTTRPGAPPARSGGRRVALYSHDTKGLGHVRRNSMIAAALVAADPEVEILLLAGTREASALPLPARTSVVTAPELAKDLDGTYRARSLPLPLDTVIGMRAAILQHALDDFAPDLLIVDKVPLGVHRELQTALAVVRAKFGTRTVLGLRDVLDEPSAAVREWDAGRTSEVISHSYDQVWVYTDPAIYDPAVEYGWPGSVRAKLAYTGYLARGRSDLLGPAAGAETPRVRSPYVLGLVGGGQDGAALSRAFVGATFPAGHLGVLVTGPYLPGAVRDELRAACADRDDVVVLDFVAHVPALINGASASVAMGGYNTVCELLDSGRPVLLAPRTVPRREQSVRAERLRAAGLVDVLTPGTLTAERVTGWLADAVARPRRAHASVDLGGLARIPELVDDLLACHRPRKESVRAAV